MCGCVSAVQFIPHLSVLDNLTLARAEYWANLSRREQARFYLEVGLAEKTGSYPDQLWWTKATGSDRA